MLYSPRVRLGATGCRTLCLPVLYAWVLLPEIQWTEVGKLFRNKYIYTDDHSPPCHHSLNNTTYHVYITLTIRRLELRMYRGREGMYRSLLNNTLIYKRALRTFRFWHLWDSWRQSFRNPQGRLCFVVCFIYYSCSYCNSLVRCGFCEFCKHV